MKRDLNGFTLIELLVVMAIIGVLAAVVMPNLLAARGTSQDRAAAMYGRSIEQSALAYMAENIARMGADVAEADCRTGYTRTVGYELGNPGSAVTACAVIDLGSTEFVVEVQSITGAVYHFPRQ